MPKDSNKPAKRTITVALDKSKAFDTINIHSHTYKEHLTNIPHTISNSGQTISKDAKPAQHSETKHQHKASSKLVYHIR